MEKDVNTQKSVELYSDEDYAQRIQSLRDIIEAHDKGDLTPGAALVAASIIVLKREPTEEEKAYARTLKPVDGANEWAVYD